MNTGRKRRGLIWAIALLICAFALWLGTALYRATAATRRAETEHILHFYGENIVLQLKGGLNRAQGLAQMAQNAPDGAEWFEAAARELLAQEAVRYLCLIEGDVMVRALPQERCSGLAGQNIQDLSYVYTLAKYTGELLVEGPIPLGEGPEEVFLFLQPVTRGGAYLGEIAVALDSAYVLEQLDLDYLIQRGYDYELWRVDPETGHKGVISSSSPGGDFSHAAKSTFYLPTQWNLSIQPKNGWVSPSLTAGIIAIGAAAALLLFALFYAVHLLLRQREEAKKTLHTDRQTGMQDREGFCAQLDGALTAGRPVMLFYFVFENAERAWQLIPQQEALAFLQSLLPRMAAYIHSPFFAGRLGAGQFAVAVSEEMDQAQREDFAKGLSLELLLKVVLLGEKSFLSARYCHAACLPDAPGEQQLGDLVRAYYAGRAQGSPARLLTEKCRRLIEGESDVVFEEYADPEMTELSKTFNQYRKQTEQLAYFDPVFNVGNRPKFLRDANLLISFDQKRPFTLYCVDIRDFNQYNELFSTDVGDAILRETVLRLSRPFGTYLYRINGDVFLGLSMSGEDPHAFARRLHKMLMTPLSVGSASFVLQLRIAACCYPAHGRSPELLQGRIQSALRFAKQTGQDTIVYNGELDEALRTEADILRRLKAGIREETLEVWYQPMYRLQTGAFSAAEALVRLPDGRGGYFSAGQVVALAERSGLVEELGDYVLGRACSFMRLRGRELGLAHMGVNISVQQLLIGNSAEHLLEQIRAAGARPDQITLEITESILIQSIDNASRTLDDLRQNEVRIALDDFGVGYSSLNYLSNLPVDVLKIDRSLTKQILTSQKQQALLHTIAQVAHINSLAVVAEGVETREEEAAIAAAGVAYIQGFYRARPLSEEDLAAFLQQKQ